MKIFEFTSIIINIIYNIYDKHIKNYFLFFYFDNLIFTIIKNVQLNILFNK